MRKRLTRFLPLFFLLCTLQMQANTDSIRISLLTCAPGEEIYELFGHTAIRYEDSTQGIDVVFNYGLFSFSTPNFLLRFAMGETDYQLGIAHYEQFVPEYEADGRGVWQQTLNLTPAEKEELVRLLQENYLPQNRVYRYNYFYDNCATRPRDKIEECIAGRVVYPTQPQDGSLTYRDIVHQYSQKHPWTQFGIDLCIGSQADRPISQRQMMFAPLYLMEALAGAQIASTAGELRPLVDTTQQLIAAQSTPAERTPIPTPLQCATLLLVATLAATLYGIRRQRSLWGIDLVLFGTVGLVGCFLAFLALCSQHPAVDSNYLLLLFHPAHLLFLPSIVLSAIKKQKPNRYLLVNSVILTLFILLFPLLPQKFNFTVVPLALCLLIRSVSPLMISPRKRP